jgi:hypothetical protein
MLCNHYNKRGVSKALASRQLRERLKAAPGMRGQPGDQEDQIFLETIDVKK